MATNPDEATPTNGAAEVTPTGEEASASVIDEFVPVDLAREWFERGLVWVQETLFNIDVAIQLGLIVAAVVPAMLFGNRFRMVIRGAFANRVDVRFVNRLVEAVAILSLPIVLYLTLTLINIALGSAGRPTALVGAAMALITAWIIVRMVTLVIGSPFWSSVAFYVAWPIAALDAFGALGPVVEQMQALAIPLGENSDGEPIRITLLDVVRTLFYFAILFWGANLLSKLIQQQIDQVEELTPTFKALLGKILNILLPIVALLIAFQIVGFNVTTLAVFSGAVGLGIGLGLQRVVANFIAGFTLLADKSIKPDDVIEIDGTMGWVTSMQGRYVALRTRDGTEMLIPNDRFMSEGVTNWSRMDRVVRLHAPFGVSYSTEDLEAVQKLAVESAEVVDRVVDNPSPVCNLMEFGDSSVNFDLRFWIRDPENGLSNVRSEVLMGLWKRLHEAGIEIPFPQRDLHVRSWSPPIPRDEHED